MVGTFGANHLAKSTCTILSKVSVTSFSAVCRDLSTVLEDVTVLFRVLCRELSAKFSS